MLRSALRRLVIRFALIGAAIPVALLFSQYMANLTLLRGSPLDDVIATFLQRASLLLWVFAYGLMAGGDGLYVMLLILLNMLVYAGLGYLIGRYREGARLVPLLATVPVLGYWAFVVRLFWS